MSICVIAFFCLFYNRIFAGTFDESFTRAIGKNAGAYNLALAVIIAVIMIMYGREAQSKTRIASPVSYTHLDVYKRQDKDCSACSDA